MCKYLFLFAIVFCHNAAIFGQTEADAQKIYDTEKSFERAVATGGINQAFLEYSAPDGTCFFPGYPVNCVQYFKTQPTSTAALAWNPNFVDVSSNGLLAYSTGNSIYRPAGKNDANAVYGQYLTVWQRQPDGSYKAVVDAGVSHEKPSAMVTDWKPASAAKELNEGKSSAADSVNAFFETANRGGLINAYKMFAADDVRALREGAMPIAGKKDLQSEVKKTKGRIAFAKRSVFFGSADMAYTTNSYTVTRSDGMAEKGNFVQIWKLRGGKWRLVMDVFVPMPQK